MPVMAVATNIREKLDYLVRSTGREEAEIVARAMETGVSELYRRQVSDAYLAGDLGRPEAVSALGDEMVEELDYVLRCVEKDVAWGLR